MGLDEHVRPQSRIPRFLSNQKQRSCQGALLASDAFSDASSDAYSSLAPRWHTALLVALIFSVAVTGTFLDRSRINIDVTATSSAAPHTFELLTTYAAMLSVQVAMVVYVARVGRTHWALRDLFGRRWNTISRAVTDIGLAAAVWAAITVIETVWLRIFGARQGAAIVAILPHSQTETAVWVVVALSVGAAEEVVYRGYLQAQMTAFTGRPAVALIVQAVLFGLAHGNQGLAAAFRIGIYAMGLGALARARRSLMPGILCHVFSDIVATFSR